MSDEPIFLITLPDGGVVVSAGGSLESYGPDGVRTWSVTLPGSDVAVCPPAVSSNSNTYVRGEDALYAFSPAGDPLWVAPHQDSESEYASIIALPDSSPAMTAADLSLICYDLDGQVKWTFALSPGDRLVAEPSVASNGYIYLRGARHLYCVGPSGKINWQL